MTADDKDNAVDAAAAGGDAAYRSADVQGYLSNVIFWRQNAMIPAWKKNDKQDRAEADVVYLLLLAEKLS